MENRVTCPWCNKEEAPVRNVEQGSNGRLRITRCGGCRSILSVRLDSEPDDIIKKLPGKRS